MDKKSKENILKRLKDGLNNKTSKPYKENIDILSIFPNQPKNLKILFEEQFKALGGFFYSCSGKLNMYEQISKLIFKNKWSDIQSGDTGLVQHLQNSGLNNILTGNDTKSSVSISNCQKLIARTGSILFNSTSEGGRKLSISPDIQIVISSNSQLVYNINEALLEQKKNIPLASMLCIVSGASRTADIEKTLVMGAHGPREIHLFFLEEN